MSYFKVYDKLENCFLEPIYRAYEGKVFDFYLGSSGTLTFRCEGMQDKGFPNGYTHESIITQGKDRFEIIINSFDDEVDLMIADIIKSNNYNSEIKNIHNEYRELKLINPPTLNNLFRMKEIKDKLKEVVNNEL